MYFSKEGEIMGNVWTVAEKLNTILVNTLLFCKKVYTLNNAQKSHYPPSNHYASHL